MFCAQTYVLDFKHKEGDFGTRVGWSGQEVCVIGHHLKVWERGDAGSNQSSLDDSGIDVDKPELRILCPWRKRHRISNCILFFYLYGSKSQIAICFTTRTAYTTPSDIRPSIRLWKNFPQKNPFNSWAASAVIRYVEPETWKESRTHKHRRRSAAFTQTNTPRERETL